MNSFSKYLFEHLHFGLEEKDFTLIEKIIFFLIILNCVFVVIESEKLIYEQYSELFDSVKLFFGIIFLIFQMPILKQTLQKNVKQLFKEDGNFNEYGMVVFSGLFAGAFYSSIKMIDVGSLNLTF